MRTGGDGDGDEDERDRSGQTSGRVGSRSGHGSHRTARARPVPITGSGRVGPCTLRGRVGSGFFRVGSGFLAFGSGFSGWVGFWVKNHGPCPAR